MKLKILFIFLLLIAIVNSSYGAVSSGSADDMAISEIQQLLAEMPDIDTEPDEYNIWKIRYNSFLRGESADAVATTVVPMDWRCENGYVAADVDETTGEFDEGGDPAGGSSYVKLTFSWPESPGTEWVMYYVDGTWGKTSEALPNTSSNYMSGDTVISIWNNYNGVYIRQEIVPVRLGTTPGENEQIRFKAVMKPADSGCHNCGCIVYYDTMLDWNDAAEISTAFGYTGIAEIFFAPDIPPIWRAYENGFPPGAGDLVALGILIGFEATMPDIFWYGSWPSSVGNGWDDADWITDTGAGFGDSATMVKWYPRYICPGDSVVYVTYYGIGDISGTGLTLSHNPPTISATCGAVDPDPMTLTALITNMGTATANNVTVTLDLTGADLNYVGGDPISTYFSSIAGYGGSQMVNWQVDIPISAYGTTQCYTIIVNYDEGGPITENYCVTIPEPIPEPTPSAWADDYDICEGECTFIHADPGTTSGGGGSCPGFSTNFDSDNGGFSASGSWQWGTPTSGPGSAHTNPYCWGTNLSGDYSNDVSWTLTSPNIDLSICSDATLTFWHYYDTEGYFDGGNVKISTDGGSSWNIITPTGDYPEDAASSGNVGIPDEPCYSGHDATWRLATFDLTPYVGGNIRLRWHFGSDYSVIYPGWYVDDVNVFGSGGGTITWNWYWSPTTGLSDPNSTDPQACPTTTTTYTFTVTDGADCEGTSSVTINVYPQPTVSIPDRTICYGESTTLTATITGSYTSITWSTGASGTDYISVSPTSTTQYWVEVCNNDCCDRDTSVVTVSPEITVDCGPVPAEVCEGSSITLNATVSGGIAPYSYVWYPAGGLDNPISANPNASPSSSQWYYCTVTDDAGCDATDSVWVEVLPLPTAPTLISIFNGATDIPPGDTCLYWYYQSDVIFNVYFDGALVASGITDTFWCTTLACDETHSWYVQAENSCGTENSPTWTFSTMTSPDGLSLISPPDGTTEIPPGNVTLDWTDASGSSPIYYNLYIDGSPYATGLTSSQFEITVACNETIQWYVEAYNDCGTITSSTWVFYTETGPEGITLSSPADGSTEIPAGDVDLVWNPPTSGSEPFTYDVYVDGIPVATGLTSTSYTITVECDDTLEWYVVATNTCGSDTSEIWTFSTETGPEGIALVSPADSTEGIPPGDINLNWDEPTSGSEPFTYDVYVDGIPVATGLTSTSYTITVECDDTLEWYVVATNSCGSDTSEIWTFSTRISPDGIVLFSPPDDSAGILPGNVTLVWSSPTEGGGPFTYSVYYDGELLVEYLSDTTYTVTVDCSENHNWYVVVENICGADTSEIWDFNTQECGFPMAALIEPFEGAWSACEDQNIIIRIFDPLGIDANSIRLSVNGTAYDTTVPHLTYVNDTLYFVPDPLWSDGDSVWFCLDSAANIYGVPVDTFCSWFRVDLSPPVASAFVPPDGAIIADPSPVVGFSIQDILSGLLESSVQLTITWSTGSETFLIGDYGVTWDGVNFYVDLDEIGIEFSAGENVEVCVNATDNPDYCPPNELDTCWNFQLVSEAPVAELITPEIGATLSCADQQIILTISSAVGIESSSIQFQIGDEIIGVDDSRLNWEPDTLTFTPSPLWSDGDSVHWALLYAEDVLGESLVTSIDGWFIVDITSPIVYEFYPLDGDTISTASPGVYIILADSISGIDTSDIDFWVDGNPASYTIIDSTDGEITYWIITYDGAFPHNDTAEICISLHDLVDTSYCPANVLDFCWTFQVDLYGPIAEDIYDPASSGPLNDAISSCGNQGFCFSLVDTAVSHGVAPATIVVSVNGTEYTLSDPELNYADSIICFTPDEDFSDGEVVEIVLISAEDFVGNPLTTTYSWSYTIDLSPPYVPPGAWPSDGAEIATLTPTVTFGLLDHIAGVDWETFEICVSVSGAAPICFGFSDAGVDSSGGIISANFSTMGITLEGGDNVEFCVSADDAPDFCPPNELDTCWEFSIPVGGPRANPLEPLDGTYSACDDQQIIINLADMDGVVESTIEISINGTHYTTADAELEYFPAPADSLVFTPSALWTDGTVVICSLLTAEDTYGNPLESAPVVWSFTIDLVPPVISGMIPAPGEHILGTVTMVEMDVTDAGSGVDDSLIYATVDGTPYHISEPCVIWSGTHYALDMECAGLIPDRGDTIEICFYAGDSPDYCAPNEIDTCYLIWIMDCDLTVEIEMDDTVICNPDGPVEFVINATTNDGVPPYSYLWSPAGAISGGHIEDITAIPPIGTVTEYIIEVTDSTGCTAYDTVYVTVSDPQVNAGDDIWVCPDGAAFIGCSPVISGAMVGPVDISWHYLDGTTVSDDSSFFFEPESTVTLYVELIDGVGCSDYDTMTVYYEHESPGPFGWITPEPNDTLPPGEVELCWEMPEGETPIYFDVFVDGAVVVEGITDTCYTVGPFPCGEYHTWFIEAYNLCIPIDCEGDTCEWTPDSGGFEEICGPVIVIGDTFSGGFDPPFYTDPCPTGAPEIVEPLESTWSTCDNQQIIIRITPPDSGLPIDPTSIRLTVESTTYMVSGIMLDWSEPLLTFTPASPWSDGQTVDVCLDSVCDEAGTSIEGLPLCWQWFVDLSPPVFWNQYPTDSIYDWQAEIGVKVIDSLRTVNPDSFLIEIENVFSATGPITLHWGNPAISYDDTTLIVEPSLVDHEEFGLDYSWCEDSQIVDGIYFPEMTTIHIRVFAQDTIPDYCGPNESNYSWEFYILDDDISPPSFTNFLPAYVSTRTSFTPSVEIYDSSGISDIAGYTPIMVYDTDGELETDCDSIDMRLEDCWTEPSGIVHCEYIADGYIGPYDDTCTVTIGVYAYDGDYDFCNLADMSLGYAEWTVPILDGPSAEPIIPLPDSITACDDQQIIIHLWDPDGIDESSITLNIAGSVYDISDPELEYMESTEELIFTPSDDYFTNEQTVTVSLTGVLDELGNPMWEELTYTFQVDLQPPEFILEFPDSGMMVRSSSPDVRFTITDNLAGISTSSVVLYVKEIPYTVDGSVLEWNSSDNMSGTLLFHSELAGLIFPPSDTVGLRLTACDKPDYCDPNCNFAEWWFTVEPEVGCYIHPNPFTPNNDSYNEIVIFDYPNMYSENAVLHILNMRNIEVYSDEIGPIGEYEEYYIRSWNGLDNNGNPLPPGLYIYVIVAGDGEVLCNGTVLLVR